ncbi:MAG: gamma-butyrobetaine hydroxylase-like domain-containing protein [Candidatus Kapaibacterium sp.]
MKKRIEMKPKNIKRTKPYLIEAEWPDGFRAVIKLEKLRAECPCATCTGEQIGDKVVLPAFKSFKEGMNELIELKKVGNYAISAVWGDGHDTGIYPWEVLRDIFNKHKLSDEELKELEEKYG